jgi:hypothetical protein
MLCNPTGKSASRLMELAPIPLSILLRIPLSKMQLLLVSAVVILRFTRLKLPLKTLHETLVKIEVTTGLANRAHAKKPALHKKGVCTARTC